MSPTENEHDWFTEQIAAYLTDGLSDAERSRFESHAQSCPDCARELEQFRQMEAAMSSALAGTALRSDFEDRLLSRLRLGVRFRQWIHPLVRRAAVAAAIGIVVAGFGYVGKEFLEHGRLPEGRTIAMDFKATSDQVRDVLDQVSSESANDVNERRIQQQRQYVHYTIDNSIERSDISIAAGDFAASQRAIESARIARNTNPALFSDEELQQFDQRLADAQARLDKSHPAHLQLTRAREAQPIVSEQKAQTVSALIREARGLTSQGKYQQALGVLDQVLKLDPKNDYALGARPLIEDRALVEKPDTARYERNVVRQYNEAEDQKIPYSDILRYPAEWPDLQKTRERTVATERGEREEDQAIAAELQRKLPEVRFEDASLGDVVEFMRDVSLANIYVDWKSLEAAGINRDTPVTVRLRDVKFDQALNTIASTVDGGTGKLQVGVDNGVVVLDARNQTTRGLGETSTENAVTQTAFLSQPDMRFKPSNFSLTTPAPRTALAGDADGDGVVDHGVVVDRHTQATKTNLAANSIAMGPADAPATQPAGAAPAQAAPSQPAAVSVRRVIRDGVMEFEVDSFDSAFVTISKITAEEGGFIAAADSDKLPNGKVRGTITLRVPPDRLDTLILKLRALGELKSQKLGSKDISREYTDLESELRAARAMEERLLEMIRNAKGKVSELLEAEKELGIWRTRIEKITGQLNYYNNLVSMATLSITAYEKDIRTPASASQTEEINTGLETDDVEHARAEVIKSIDEAKGRIVESELKQLEAGQLAAKVIAEVAPENAGPILDRLKQLGRVARLDIQRKQVADSAKPQAAAPVRVETAPTRLIISMYNLANVAPRLTTNLNLAGDDVEAVYRAILKRVGDANGRVISSNLQRQDATQANGAIQFEVKAAEADAILNDIRTQGLVQVLRLNVTENPDTANVTTAKQAFTVQIIPSAQVAPRETRGLTVQTSNVEGAMQTITTAASSAGGRVVESSLAQDNTGRTVARIAIEVPLGKADQLVDTARQQGKVRTSESTKNAQVPEGPLSRARLVVTISTEEAIVSSEHGLWNTIRNGLGTSVRGLLWSLQLIIIGVCLIAPWALLLWGGWKLARGRRAPAA